MNTLRVKELRMCVCVCTSMCAGVYICGGQVSIAGVFCLSISCVLRQGLPVNLEFTDLVRLGAWEAPGIHCLSLCLPSTWIINTYDHSPLGTRNLTQVLMPVEDVLSLSPHFSSPIELFTVSLDGFSP